MPRKPPKPTNIPEAKAVPTKADRRAAVYKLYVDLTQAIKGLLKDTSEKELEALIAAHLNLMNPPEGVEELTIPVESMKQTALLANQAVARQLYERYKK